MWFVLNAVGVDLICIHYTYLMGGDGFVFVGYNTLGHGKIFAWNVDMLWAYYKTLRYYATSLKFAGSIPDDVIGIFHRHNPSGRTVALGSTQPLPQMSTRNISWGVKATGA